MYLAVLAFLIGVMTLPFFKTIPSLWLFPPVFLITALLSFFSQKFYKIIFKFISIALLGCMFVLFRSEQILKWQLPENLETKTITITGIIDSLPKISDDEAQFEFLLESINKKPEHTRIHLSWYHYNGILLEMGSRWQMQVHLKRSHGLLNPGGFDYEKWLFSRGIRATGYVVNPEKAKLLQTQKWKHPVDNLRQYLQQKIENTLADQPTKGLISALIMGAQNGITEDQWQVMRATGTNHLMAIAGVHIAFISGFIYTIANFFWRRSMRLMLKLPAPQAAALAALISAVIYSALAGFALPTQRALAMLVVFMLGLFLRRTLNAWNSFSLALLLMLLWDPLATLSISFWLSFGAVFAIIYGITGRLKPKGLWWKYGRVQWVITITLIPISLVLFQQSSMISFVANLIAVPTVGILVLPLCLIGALLIIIFPLAGHWVLWLAAKIISVIWWVLAWLGNLQGAVWQQTMPSIWVLASAVIGVLLLIAPRGFPACWLGFLWLSPLIFFRPAMLPENTVRFTLLDVGQGLSVVVQTKDHVLIFDTGPPMGKHADAGNRVILPFLQAMGIKKVDMLIVSHGDSDHIGGALSTLKEIPVSHILTSVPERFFAKFPKHYCENGQTWRWNGVIFRMLYPTPEFLHKGNNSSCVLRVEAKGGSILLTGDIEKPAEEYLVKHANLLLPSTVLIAPHHGSRTSSTAAFIKAVHPNTVLFPLGYKNRYRFPNKLVVARYRQAKIAMFDTAKSGAITLEIGDDSAVGIILQRDLEKRIWHDEIR